MHYNIIIGIGEVQTFKSRRSSMATSYRRFHYLFAHIGLPKIFFSDPNNLYEKLHDNAELKINEIWRTLAKEFSINLLDSLHCKIHKLVDGMECFIITMPDPGEITEAKFIGLLFKINKNIFSTSAIAHRYYTAEKSGPVDQNQLFFCEWSGVNQHNNFGLLKENTENNFFDTIHYLYLFGRKNRDYKVNLADIVTLQDPNKEKTLLDHIVEANRKLNPIIDNWKGKISESYSLKLSKASVLMMRHITKSMEIIDKLAPVTNPEISKLKKDSYTAVGFLENCCFYTGIEYGSQDINLLKINFKSEIPQGAKALINPAGDIVFAGISTLNEIASELSPENKLNDNQLVKDIHTTIVNCFKIGVEAAISLQPISSQKAVIEYDLTETAYEELVKVALTDPDPDVRNEAQKGVQELFPGGQQGFDDFIFHMLEGLRNPDTRDGCFLSLTSFGEMILPKLRIYLSDPDPDIRKLITRIIIEIGNNKK